MGKAEFVVEGYLRDQALRRGYKCYKLTSPGIRGMPDRIIVGKGVTVYVECKSAVGQLEPVQRVRIRELCKQGVPVWVTSTREQVDAVMAWMDALPDAPETPVPEKARRG